ncbi:HD domain-containing protein [Microvirga rosea]|uniref:HD domain-containing protein n=1 Tax=Microvirga rosea TaxID=2715425 RepID=UPI001D0A3FAB|nr:HD domain-containing protein [Microvirga rosea]MCB8821924.1 HD domain-containing protein [Microvirga rosea]
MARPKFFRDPIHQQLRFEDVDLNAACPAGPFPKRMSWLLRRVIDDPAFQRLRFVRQNGLANLVFHGAEHTRFTHSLGVSYLAQTMFERICRNNNIVGAEDDELRTVTAALLHDIGHGPFSHTMEEILGEANVNFHHEAMTLRFIQDPQSSIHKLLVQVDQQLPKLLTPFFDKAARQKDHWSYKVVSSQLDADRLDYLQRDATFAGLRGHGFDLERILDLLSTDDDKRIAVERGAIESIEAYLVTLDQLYRAVYYHHTVRAATKMLTSLFRRAVNLYKSGDKQILRAGGDDIPLKALVDHGQAIDLAIYARFSEFHLWHLMDTWRDHKDPIIRELSSRLLERRLFKTLPVDPGDYQGTNKRMERAKAEVRKQYAAFANEAVDYFVMYDEPSRTSYKTYDWKPESSEDSIWLVGGGKNAVPLEADNESTIIQAFKNRRYFPRMIVPPEVRDSLTNNA